MKCSWREGNKIQLLENGEQYYPAVFKAIGEAQERIILETFIWFEDDVGKQLHAALLAAAQRGVKAEVLLDGYGSPDLSDEFVNELTAAGVVFRYYDPRPRLFGMRTNVFRRMHRKIVVIDARIAFIGGLNYSAEHMSSYGPEAKQDYAVRLEGPIVALKGRLLKISSSLNWKICQDKARPDAGGDVITKRKKIASREKRRYCWSGVITKNIAMISNATI